MKSIKLALLYGFLVWLSLFVVGFMAFIVRDTNRPLFESVMTVGLTLAVVVFSSLYFSKTKAQSLQEGLKLGLLWMLISIVIDAPLFLLGGPMKMTLSAYVSDIAVTYLAIPVITAGVGHMLAKK